MWWCADVGRTRSAGFVLLEAVLALAIIGMVAVALLAATGAQVRNAGKASELLRAQSLAEDRLAAVRLLDHEELSDLPDSLGSGIFPSPFQDFGWTAVVAEMEDEHDLFGVGIVVTGPAEVYPLRTLVHRARPVVSVGEGGR